MKKFLGIVVLGLLWCNTSFAESRLPPCQGEDHTQFVNCFGSYVGKDFSEIHNTPGLTSDYSGEFGNSPGLAHGKGTFEIYLNGEYYGKCKGEIKNELMNGEGICIWKNGEKYIGEFKDDLFHGQGTYTFADGGIYVGEWKFSKVNGQGTMTYPNGAKYIGEFKDDLFHGQGTYTFANGTKYIGEFKDDVFHGQGTMTYADGVTYVGEWKEGKLNGQGTMTYPNGAKYIGEFKDDLFHGQGTYTFANGAKYIGEFKDDVFHGQGTMTYADGTVEKGIWKNDKFHKAEKEKIDLKKHIEKHRIKKDVKLKCMLTFVEPYKQEKSMDNEFYLSLDSKNNQIIANGFIEYWGALNITYDEINFNDDGYIIANTTIIRRGKNVHLRLMIDKYTGDMEVTGDKDYNNEGIEKSLEDKISGDSYYISVLGHKASCSEKLIM